MGGVSWDMVKDSYMKLRRRDSKNGANACRGKRGERMYDYIIRVSGV